jgi:Phosphotransferase enzyme family
VPDWTSAAWLAEAHGWIEQELARLGTGATGPIAQPHVYPWSTVLRVPTPDGDLWFKANVESLAYEAAVVSLLSERRPDCVPPLLAVDLERGWMLMADAGTRLRELVEQERELGRWLEILLLYAGVQLDLAGEADDLVARGAPDRRLARLPTLYEELLDDLGTAWPVDDRERLRGEVERVWRLSEELADFAIPETIQHDDLHDGQVFVRDGRYRLLDWADSCVSHPFFTLSVTLEGNLAWGLDDIAGSVDTASFRDAYLEPFAREYGDRDLVAAATIALRLGWVCRAINGRLGDSNAEHTLTRLRMFLGGL